MKWIKTVAAAGMVLLLLVTQHWYSSSRMAAKVDALESENVQLSDYLHRLRAARRVAQVTVLDQQHDEMNRTVTRLLWQEIESDGLIGPPVEIETLGSLVYFEALVVKFEHLYVERADAERGTSLALFRRVFGDQQVPESAELLRRPPSAARVDGGPAGLDDKLWERFWDMMDNPQQAARFGVRIVQCEAPAVPVSEGQIWELSLDAAGGLNIKRRAEANPLLTQAEPNSAG